jgi:hypothetical protein
MVDISTVFLVCSILTINFQITPPFLSDTLTVGAPKLICRAGGMGTIFITAILTILVEIATPFFRDTFLFIQALEFSRSAI